METVLTVGLKRIKIRFEDNKETTNKPKELLTQKISSFHSWIALLLIMA